MSVALTKLTPGRGSYLGTMTGKGVFLAGQAIGASAVKEVDLDVSDFDNITIVASMTAGAATDITFAVIPIREDDSADSIAALLPATQGVAVLSGGHAAIIQQYDLRGLQAIAIQVTNHNAAGQTIDYVDVYAGVTGVDF